MASSYATLEGALYELVSRGKKDTFFFEESNDSLYIFDNTYEAQAPQMSEIRRIPSQTSCDFGRNLQFDFDLVGDMMRDPTLVIKLPSWLPSNIESTNPEAKQTPAQSAINHYIGQGIVPQIKTYQGPLNIGLANKYGKAYNPTTGPTINQFLDSTEGAAALGSTEAYQDFLNNTKAYNDYRGKTQIPGTNTTGTSDPNAEMYGARYYNMFTPGYTAPAQPTISTPLTQKALGGQFAMGGMTMKQGIIHAPEMGGYFRKK